MNIKSLPPDPAFLSKNPFCKWVILPLCLILFVGYTAIAQKLLDPAGPISIVVASSSGSNSSVSVAYAIRQLKTTYDHPATITPPTSVAGFTNSTTPLVRVLRSTDNGQLDIGYDANGNLDSVLLKNFVTDNGANATASGYVTVWYDQSGNSRDAYPPTTAARPRIVNAGVIERNSGGQIGFYGVNGGMLEHRPSASTTFNGSSGSNIYGITGDRTMNVVSQPKTYSGAGTSGDGAGTYLIDRYGDPATANGGTPTGIDNPLTSLKAVGSNWALQIRLNSATGFPTGSFSGSIGISTSRSDNVMVVRSGDVYALYVNGVLAGNSTLSGANYMSPVRIGYGSSTGETVYYGEFILFPSALSSDDLAELNTNQTDYYVLGTPGNTWTGLTSTDWATASNWSNSVLPDALSSVTIPSGTPNAPTINSTVSVKKITVNSSATLTVTTGGTLSISDSLTVNGTIAGSGSGTVVMNGGIKQIISGTGTIGFVNLTISNTINQVVANNNINVSGSLTVNSGAVFNPLPAVVLNNSGAGTSTITGSGTIMVTRTASTADYQSQYKFNTNTLSGLTTEYAGAGAQTINLGVNYGNLTISGSGTKTLSAAVSATNVTGNINVTSGTLSNGGFAIVGNAARTFSVSNGATFLLAGTTSAYPTVFGTFTFGATSTVEYGGTGAQTIAAANYGNLTSSGSGTRTMANSGTIGIAGTFTKGANTYTVTGSTIDYNGTGPQTVLAMTYNNLTISSARISSPNITLESGTITVPGTLSVTSTGVGSYIVTGNTVNYSGATQTVDADITYNNLTLSGSGTVTTTGVSVNGILSLEGTTTMSATPTFGTSSTLKFDKTGTFTANTTDWPLTFSGSGGVIVTSTAVTTLSNNARTITYALSIETGSILNLGTPTGHSTGYLYLGGTLQTTAGTYGGTGSSATVINSTYFSDAAGRVSVSAKNWTGASSTNWNTAGNWSPSGVPTNTNIVTIPTGVTNMPNVGAAATCLDLILGSGTTLTVAASQTLTVAGNFTNQGGTISGTGTVAFSGTTKTISGTTTAFAGLTINDAASISLSGSHSCTGLTFATAGNNTSLTHSSTASLTVNGAVTINQPTSNTRSTSWNINAGTAAVSGLITLGANSANTTTSRVTEIVITSGTLSANGGITFANVNNVGRRIVMSGGAGFLNITGALTLQGQQTLTAGTSSTVNFTGSTAQSIPFFSSGGYNHLSFSNSAGATLSAAISATNVTGNVSVQTGILANGGFAIVGNATDTFTVDNGATLSLSGTSAFPTGFGTTVLGTSSTVNYAGTGAQSVAALTYGNLTLSGARTTNSITLANGSNIIIMGTFSPTATFSSGNYITTNNTIVFNSSSSQTIPAFNYNSLLSSSTGARVFANSGTIGIAGSFTPGSNTYTTTGSTVNYNGTTAQTVAGFNYNNLTVSGARTTNNVTFESGGTVGIGNTFTASATFSTGAYVVTNNTINYTAATGSQTITAFTYNNLTLSNTSGTNAAGGNLVVNGTLTTAIGGTLNMGSANTLSGTLSTITNNGTITTSVPTATSATPLAASKTWGGTGTVIYALTTGVQTVVAGTYNNLTQSNTSGTNTAGGNIIANGTLTTTGGGTLNMATFTLGAGAIVNGGTIRTQNAGATPIPTGLTIGGTVNYDATTGGQTVRANAYTTLTLGNTSGTQTADGNITTTTLNNNTNAADILNMATFTLGATTINNTGTIRTQNTSATPLPTGLTIGGTVNYDATTGGQTVRANAYTTLTLGNTSGTQTAGGNITTTTLNNNTNAADILNMATFTLTATTINNAGTIRSQNTSATPLPTGLTIGGTVNYDATTGAQTIRANTYTTLTMGNTSGTQTADGNITTTTLNNNTNAADVLNMATFALTATTINNTGTIRTQNTSATPLPTGLTIGGTVNYDATTGGQTIRTNTYTTLMMGNTSGTQTAEGNIATTTLNNNTNAADVLNMATYTLTATTINNTGTIRTQNTSSTPIPTGLTIGGTVNYDAATGGQTIRANTYANLTMGNTSGTQTAPSNLSPSGTLTTTAGGTLNMATFTLTAGAITNGGTIRTQNTSATPIPTGLTIGGTVNYDAASGGQTIRANTYTTLTLGNTSGTQTADGNITTTTLNNNTNAADILNMATFTLGATTINNTGTIRTQNTSATPIPTGLTIGGTVNYDAASGGQTIRANTYTNLTMGNTSGTQTASANLSPSGTLTTTAGGTLNMSSFTLSAGAITNGGTIRTQNTSATPIPTGLTIGGTVNYDAASGGQTIRTNTYTNLTMGNTSGTQTASANLSPSGTLTTTAGGTLNMSTFTLSAGAITNGGTIRTQNTSATPIPTGLTIGGTVNYDAATGGQTIRANTYTNLTMGNTSGTQTATANLSPSGTLTTTAGGTLNMSTFTLSAGAITNGGTIRTQNTSATPIPTGLTIGGTVNYDAASGGQTVRANTYNNLTLSNTSGTQTASGNLVVNGALVTTGGGTLDMGTANTLSGTLATITNNGTISTAVPTSTSATPLASGKNWGSTGTIIYSATNGLQTVVAGTYNNLSLTNASGNQATGGNLVVNGTLTTTAGNLVMGTTNILSGTLASIVNNGTITTAVPTSTSATPIASGKTWGGTGTVQYAATSGLQTVVAGTYNNLSMSNTAGANTLGGNVVVGANFSFNNSGAKLILGSNTITFNGDILNMTAATCFTANGSSNIIIGGSGSMTNNLFLDQTTRGTTNRLNNLTYNRASQTITLGDTVEIKGIVTPTAGTLATSNKLKLISDASGDACIATGAGSYITGSVTVERFIPSHARGWRFMASPVVGSTLSDWQSEIYITGSGGATNGFDATLSNQAGVYSYDETLTTGDLNTGWVAPANTSTTLTPGKGYRVFIRGDRTPGRLDGTITTQNAVTVNAINAVNTGNVNMAPTFTNSGTLANDGWNLLGNPYPCPLDWNAFHNAGRTGSSPDFSGTDYTHLNSIVYILDAGSGAYTSYNANGGAVVGDLAGGIIPSGASFWVKASAASPTMTVKEIYKTTTAAGGVFKSSTDNGQFSLKLIASEFSYDETVVKYKDEASSGLDEFDIPKMYGANVNIASIGSDEKFLAANYKPFNGKSDTIRLSAGFAASGSYSFEFKNPQNLHPTLPVYLVDTYKNVVVNIRSNPTYVFDVDVNNSATKGNSRFMIVVGESTTPTGIEENITTALSYKLYPTITSGETTILSNFNNQKIDHLVIRDVAGRTQAEFVDLEWNNNQVKVDLSSFATGTYFITIANNGNETTLKCVKQ